MYKCLGLILVVILIASCGSNDRSINNKEEIDVLIDNNKDLPQDDNKINNNINENISENEDVNNESLNEEASNNGLITETEKTIDDNILHLVPEVQGYPDTSPEALERWNEYYDIREKMEKEQVIYDNLTENEKEIVMQCEPFSSPWDIASPGCSWYCGGIIHDVYASSFLESNSSLNYEPHNIVDERLDTAWVEGVDAGGIGENITYQVTGDISIIAIYNGYGKTQDLFLKNNRVKKLGVLIEGETEFVIDLFDTRDKQVVYINIDNTYYENATITFTIMEIYRGSKYDDTCISEIQFLGGH